MQRHDQPVGRNRIGGGVNPRECIVIKSAPEGRHSNLSPLRGCTELRYITGAHAPAYDLTPYGLIYRDYFRTAYDRLHLIQRRGSLEPHCGLDPQSLPFIALKNTETQSFLLIIISVSPLLCVLYLHGILG